MIPRNLIVEIYRGDGSRAYICDKTIEGVRKELSRLAPHIEPDPILKSLLRQREDPNLFPNIIFF